MTAAAAPLYADFEAELLTFDRARQLRATTPNAHRTRNEDEAPLKSELLRFDRHRLRAAPSVSQSRFTLVRIVDADEDGGDDGGGGGGEEQSETHLNASFHKARTNPRATIETTIVHYPIARAHIARRVRSRRKKQPPSPKRAASAVAEKSRLDELMRRVASLRAVHENDSAKLLQPQFLSPSLLFDEKSASVARSIRESIRHVRAPPIRWSIVEWLVGRVQHEARPFYSKTPRLLTRQQREMTTKIRHDDKRIAPVADYRPNDCRLDDADAAAAAAASLRLARHKNDDDECRLKSEPMRRPTAAPRRRLDPLQATTIGGSGGDSGSLAAASPPTAAKSSMSNVGNSTAIDQQPSQRSNHGEPQVAIMRPHMREQPSVSIGRSLNVPDRPYVSPNESFSAHYARRPALPPSPSSRAATHIAPTARLSDEQIVRILIERLNGDDAETLNDAELERLIGAHADLKVSLPKSKAVERTIEDESQTRRNDLELTLAPTQRHASRSILTRLFSSFRRRPSPTTTATTTDDGKRHRVDERGTTRNRDDDAIAATAKRRETQPTAVDKRDREDRGETHAARQASIQPALVEHRLQSAASMPRENVYRAASSSIDERQQNRRRRRQHAASNRDFATTTRVDVANERRSQRALAHTAANSLGGSTYRSSNYAPTSAAIVELSAADDSAIVGYARRTAQAENLIERAFGEQLRSSSGISSTSSPLYASRLSHTPPTVRDGDGGGEGGGGSSSSSWRWRVRAALYHASTLPLIERTISERNALRPKPRAYRSRKGGALVAADEMSRSDAAILKYRAESQR